MAFQHVKIRPKGLPEFDVPFNPNQYSLDKANQIAEAAIPGLQAPILQYVHGNTRSLSMELFFDTYEEQTDVRDYTSKVYKLLEIESSSHAPPVCDISWGGFQFTGVLDHVSGKFTMFLADGTPVRATLNVTFKEFIEVEVLVKEEPTESADHRKTRTVRAGDRIDTITAEEYGDPAKWRLVAQANNLDDPTALEPGDVLKLPAMV